MCILVAQTEPKVPQHPGLADVIAAGGSVWWALSLVCEGNLRS